MAEEPKFTVTFTGPQMDFIGKFTVDTLNAATAQAKMKTASRSNITKNMAIK